MSVRLMRPSEAPDVTAMMHALWPDAGAYDFSDETVFVWERPNGALGGLASFLLRPWAEGCEATPVPCIEGWWSLRTCVDKAPAERSLDSGTAQPRRELDRLRVAA